MPRVLQSPLALPSLFLVRSKDRALCVPLCSTAASPSAGPSIHACTCVYTRVLAGRTLQWEVFARHGRQLSELSWQEDVENTGKEERSKGSL